MMQSPSNGQTTQFDRSTQMASLIVFAFTSTVVMLVLVGSMIVQPVESPATQVAFPLVIGAFGAMVASVLFRRINLNPFRLRAIFSKKGGTGLASHLFTVTIVSAALAESVGIFGFVLGLLTGDRYYFYVLSVISCIGILLNFPRARRWRDLMTEISTTAQAGGTSFGASTVDR